MFLIRVADDMVLYCCIKRADKEGDKEGEDEWREMESDIFGLPNGLAPAPTGLDLDLGIDQSPSPANRLASPFVGLASPFAHLAEKRACTYFSSPLN